MYIIIFSQNSLLSASQHGLFKGRSIDTAVFDLLEGDMEKQNKILGAFLDLSKAFDSIDHQVLLGKLEGLWGSGANKMWWRLYLMTGS